MPIMSTRMTQTRIATKIGTKRTKVSLGTMREPRDWWLRIAIETPHQVSIAFIVAASSQAEKRYQVALKGEEEWASGEKRRAMPAKSIAQKAMERIVAQRKERKDKSPSKSERANSVVEKLKSSKKMRAARRMRAKAKGRGKRNWKLGK